MALFPKCYVHHFCDWFWGLSKLGSGTFCHVLPSFPSNNETEPSLQQKLTSVLLTIACEMFYAQLFTYHASLLCIYVNWSYNGIIQCYFLVTTKRMGYPYVVLIFRYNFRFKILHKAWTGWGPNGLQARGWNRGQIGNQVMWSRKRRQDGADRTRIFTHKMIIVA